MLSHQAIAGGPLLLASIGREQILDMLNKVYKHRDKYGSLACSDYSFFGVFSSFQTMLKR